MSELVWVPLVEGSSLIMMTMGEFALGRWCPPRQSGRGHWPAPARQGEEPLLNCLDSSYPLPPAYSKPKSPCSQTFKGLPARNSCSECIMEEKKAATIMELCVSCTQTPPVNSSIILWVEEGLVEGIFFSLWFFNCGFEFHLRPNSQVLSFFKKTMETFHILYMHKICWWVQNVARTLHFSILRTGEGPSKRTWLLLFFFFFSNVHSYSKVAWNSQLNKKKKHSPFKESVSDDHQYTPTALTSFLSLTSIGASLTLSLSSAQILPAHHATPRKSKHTHTYTRLPALQNPL